MKKFLTLVLALVLALGLSVPALAFTSDDSEAVDHPYDLSVYLVEYDDNDLFGMVALPESDRGYAKNEIVAAVVELFVPKDEDPFDDGYTKLDIGGDNVSFDVTDNTDVVNPLKTLRSSNAPALSFKGVHEDGLTYTLANNILDGKDTYKWLVFAKVTDDDASITAKLVDGTAADSFAANGLLLTLDGDDYYVLKNTPADADGYYTIYCNFKDNAVVGAIEATDTYEDAIRIYVDKHHASTGMAILDNAAGTGYAVIADPGAFVALGVNTDGELGIVNGAVIDTDGDTYDNIMDIYDDIVVDVFGMDYFLIGNYVRDSFFEDLVSADTIVATVDIEPWTAYVTVPDNIVVDPPKTGDAASIMGFVMVALSGAGAVALKKRG